ncbi:MAG: hypothetical protein AAF658_21895, partial [Myxococcota bacterium]
FFKNLFPLFSRNTRACIMNADGASLERTVGALALFLENAASDGRDARIVVDDVEAALVVSDELQALGIEHRRLGWLGKLAPLKAATGVAIALELPTSRRARIAWVETQTSRNRPAVDATFRLDWLGSMEAVALLAKRSEARSVTLLGRGNVVRPKSWPSRVALRGVSGQRQLVFRDPRVRGNSSVNTATN